MGSLAAQCAFARGAARVIVLDKEPYRLALLQKHDARVEVVNASEERPIDRLRELTGHGPDCAIEAVGIECVYFLYVMSPHRDSPFPHHFPHHFPPWSARPPTPPTHPPSPNVVHTGGFSLLQLPHTQN